VQHDKLTEHASDFLLFRLVPFLNEVGCQGSTQTKTIAWFHDNAPRWSADSQPEFDAEARARLKEFVTTLAIKQGTQKSLFTGRRHYQADAIQHAWVALLESGKDDGRSANIAGRNAGQSIGKTESRYVSVEPDDSDDGTPLAPWDEVDDSDRYRAWDYEIDRWFRVLNLEVIERFKRETPEDWEFIKSYQANRRRKQHSKADQNRAGAIYRKLRRRMKN
jgi:hypothetical protein